RARTGHRRWTRGSVSTPSAYVGLAPIAGRSPLRHPRAGRADAGPGRDSPRLRVAPNLPGRVPRDHKRGSPSLRGGHGLTVHCRHARNLQAGLVDHAAKNRAPRSRLVPVSGHPRPTAGPVSDTPGTLTVNAMTTPRRSRLAPVSG